MTRVFVIVLLSLIVWTWQICEIRSFNVDPEYLRKQEIVFQLLWHTNEIPNNHPEIFERIKTYNIKDVAAACTNKDYAANFEELYHENLLPIDQVVSMFDYEYKQEVKTIFEVFLNAKNFNEFMSMAAWSSSRINKISWLHAFAMAITHRPDTKNVRIPNLYEIFPNYFYNTDVIIPAYRAKSGEIQDINKEYTMEIGYTGEYPPQDTEDEYKLSYFFEDVGLNEFYFHFMNNLPYWMKSNETSLLNDIRGELYYFVHQMILNRYKLERASFGLHELEDIDWYHPIPVSFQPSMTHLNGLPFPQRPLLASVPTYKYNFIEAARNFELRLANDMDRGEFRLEESNTKKLYDKPHGHTFNMFCNALEGNIDSPNIKLYGSLDRIYRKILGFAPETKTKRGTIPSALELTMTSLRDPVFYRLAKKILDRGRKFKENLPSYTNEELSFKELRIDYVHVGELTTHFSKFESLMNHPRVFNSDGTFRTPTPLPKVRLRQMRLDYKPFSYEIGVNCVKAVKAIVRIFLGPKYNSHNDIMHLVDSRDDFYELDRWVVDLAEGSNKIQRNSKDSVYGVSDATPSELFNNQILKLVQEGSTDGVLINPILSQKLRRDLPLRLLLPRGSKSGLNLIFFVCINPVNEDNIKSMKASIIFPRMTLDGRSLGFPLDRKIEGNLELFRKLHNMYFKEIKVFHEGLKTDDDTNLFKP